MKPSRLPVSVLALSESADCLKILGVIQISGVGDAEKAIANGDRSGDRHNSISGLAGSVSERAMTGRSPPKRIMPIRISTKINRRVKNDKIPSYFELNHLPVANLSIK
jgi:hypothetical protein